MMIDEVAGRRPAIGGRDGFLEGPRAKTYCRVNYHTCATRSALQPACSLVPVLAAHPARLTTCLSPATPTASTTASRLSLLTDRVKGFR